MLEFGGRVKIGPRTAALGTLRFSLAAMGPSTSSLAAITEMNLTLLTAERDLRRFRTLKPKIGLPSPLLFVAAVSLPKHFA
jgi:hypothetical protein